LTGSFAGGLGGGSFAGSFALTGSFAAGLGGGSFTFGGSLVAVFDFGAFFTEGFTGGTSSSGSSSLSPIIPENLVFEKRLARACNLLGGELGA